MDLFGWLCGILCGEEKMQLADCKTTLNSTKGKLLDIGDWPKN